MADAVIIPEGARSTTEAVNVLIVDDEPANLLVLETVLSDPGYRLVRASSGDEALLALMGGDFAVLVLDIHMPGMSGFELAQLVKERKRTARIPIIFLTAYYGEDQHVLTGYSSGAVDYLHKPVNAAVLQTKVSVFAELHRKSLALEATNRALQTEVIERRRAEERLAELNETLDRRVTERTSALRESEARLVDANRRKDEFLATLAHELRNPLAPVKNAVQLLRRKSLDPDWLTTVCDLLDRQVRSMVRLIDDLMDVSRINQNRIELQRDSVQLTAVLNDAIETTRPLIDENEHQLIVNLPDGDILIYADRTRLAQAFTNLLNNAAKYMDRRGRIELSVATSDDEVTVSCKDDGIGLEPDKLDGIFEMFSQVEAALSRARGGLGIGLSLTRSLVELHGGTISARSSGLGSGSEFVVRLPLQVPADIREKKAQSVDAACSPRRSGLRVLVADDNADLALTTSLLLEQMGHTVLSLNDGEAAVQAAAQFGPDLVLLDVGMPGVNGYEACLKIRALPGGAAMHIVAVTGFGQPEDVQRAFAAGFDRHVVKPMEPDVLHELLVAADESMGPRDAAKIDARR